VHVVSIRHRLPRTLRRFARFYSWLNLQSAKDFVFEIRLGHNIIGFVFELKFWTGDVTENYRANAFFREVVYLFLPTSSLMIGWFVFEITVWPENCGESFLQYGTSVAVEVVLAPPALVFLGELLSSISLRRSGFEHYLTSCFALLRPSLGEHLLPQRVSRTDGDGLWCWIHAFLLSTYQRKYIWLVLFFPFTSLFFAM